jgi:hypothetical protein
MERLLEAVRLLQLSRVELIEEIRREVDASQSADDEARPRS